MDVGDTYDASKIVGIAPSAAKGRDTSQGKLDVDFPRAGSLSKRIEDALKKRLGPRAGKPQRRYSPSTKEYLGWAVPKPDDDVLNKLFGGRGDAWERYYELLNQGWDQNQTLASVYPTGWYSVTRFQANRSIKKHAVKFFPSDARLKDALSLEFPDFVARMLHSDNQKLLRYLEVKSKEFVNFTSFVDSETDTGEDLRLYRDGCMPSFDKDIRLSTSLCVPEERIQLHEAIRRASETIVGQLDSNAVSMQSTDAFEKACQAFEKVPAEFAYPVESSQALDVRAYRALSRRINRKVAGDDYADIVIHNSTRSMWRESSLKNALDMVEEAKVNLLTSLQTWKRPSEESSKTSIFDGYDYKRM